MRLPVDLLMEHSEAQAEVLKFAADLGFKFNKADRTFSCTADDIIALVAFARKDERRKVVAEAREKLRKLDDPKHPANVTVCRIEGGVSEEVGEVLGRTRGERLRVVNDPYNRVFGL